MADESVCYVIVNNISKTYHSSDLRNFFSEFLETSGFSCFHFRHRPEIQKPSESLTKKLTSVSQSVLKDKSRSVTTCCVVKIHLNRVDDFIQMYHRKHWVDRRGHTMTTRCFIKRISICEDSNNGSKTSEINSESEQNVVDRTFTRADLTSLIEMHPPVLMPNGNVGTPTKYFLEQIKLCRLPPSIIKKLGLEFPHTRAKRLYGCVDFNYGGRRTRSRGSMFEDIPLVKTSKGNIISENFVQEEDAEVYNEEEETDENDEEEEESEEEEWDRHESLHNDVTQQERTKERLFEEKIELKWEKGGSGLVFYTDAQYWDEKEGDFDAKTADDWDIDVSGYYESGSGDKDARDFLKMRLEERMRQGIYSEKVDANDFAGFEKHSKGFGRRVLESQGWKEGEGIGKTIIGIAEPVLENGQHPRNKKGFGYRGEVLKRQPMPHKRRRRRRYSGGYDDCRIRISTVYDDPLENDKPEPLLHSNFMTQLKYRKEFLKGSTIEDY